MLLCATLNLLTETSLLGLQTERGVHLDHLTLNYSFTNDKFNDDFHTRYINRTKYILNSYMIFRLNYANIITYIMEVDVIPHRLHTHFATAY